MCRRDPSTFGCGLGEDIASMPVGGGLDDEEHCSESEHHPEEGLDRHVDGAALVPPLHTRATHPTCAPPQGVTGLGTESFA